MSVTPFLFDARKVRLHRARAAKGFADAAFLHARAAEDCADRLEEINRPFPRALAYGGGPALLGALTRRALREKLGVVLVADSCAALAPGPASLVFEQEAAPLAAGSCNLVVSCLALHWANDLPGALVQSRLALAIEGLFLGVVFGAATLLELREALLAAEAEMGVGASLRIAPFADCQDMAGLLQRAGFAQPVADSHILTVRYAQPLALLRDLQAMGESAAFTQNPRPLTRKVLARALQIYTERFSDHDGRVRASFELITATGWAL